MTIIPTIRLKIMLLSKPHLVFAFFSLLIGLFLVFYIPPIGGIDENHHVRRASEVSQGIFINPVTHTEDPLTLWSDNAWVIRKNHHEQGKPWNFADVKNIGTGQPKERTIDIEQNILSLNSPVIYIPFGLVLKLAKVLFAPDYWVQFYILRITALLLSVALFTLAIIRMPEHKILLATAGLLPIMFYNRSGMNVDGITIGCASLFIIQVHNLCRKNAIISFSDKLQLLLWGFLMAQCKGAYAPLLFLVLFIPRGNFISRSDYWRTALLIITPALLCGLGWSGFAKYELLAGVKYFTKETIQVWPDGQFQWILQHPFSYAGVVLKTIFASNFITYNFIGMIGYLGWNGFSLPTFPIVILLLLFIAILASEPVRMPLYKSTRTRLLLLMIAGITFGMMLTMIYVQWTGYQSPTVVGFQGRYFYPLLPLLIIFAKPIKDLVSEKRATLLLWAFGAISSASLIYSTWQGNY
ncbi:MAG: DUF2142 domain-containing protein [Rickettsiales bacterium]